MCAPAGKTNLADMDTNILHAVAKDRADQLHRQAAHEALARSAGTGSTVRRPRRRLRWVLRRRVA